MPADENTLLPRRRLLAWLALAGTAKLGPARSAIPEARNVPTSAEMAYYAPVVRGRELRFPRDEGSHPDFRTEWWYVTGWLRTSGASMSDERAERGFQITFFRTRPRVDVRNPSALAARQIIIAHAALSERSRGRLLHDQTIARAAFDLAGANENRTHVWVDDWSLTQERNTYRARIPARTFAYDLIFEAVQEPLLQGDEGYSRKGPRAESASYYYSLPQLKVSGTVAADARTESVSGSGWLDHEWSSSYMDERASGWDWFGINLDDGSAVMAFRMRTDSGGKLWAGGTHRTADGRRRTFGPDDIHFEPVRTWRSPRMGTSYPVSWRVRVGPLVLVLEPLMDDQENDTRASVGTVYWEGAVRALAEARVVGRGYLELTGYWRAMKL